MWWHQNEMDWFSSFCDHVSFPTHSMEISTSGVLSLPPCYTIPTTVSSLKKAHPFCFFFTTTRSSSSIICCNYYTNPRRRSSVNWYSNAENFGSKKRFEFGDEPPKKTKWWSDEEDDEYEGEDGGGGGIIEEAIDNVWIFKVFRSLGWMLPAVILSMLGATGPKAFLMALALPLGQSAISLLINKLFGRKRDRPKPRFRTKKRPFTRAATSVEEEVETTDEFHDTSEPKQGYQSWVAADDETVKNNVNQRANSFGGWEELDRRKVSDKERRRKKKSRQSAEKGKLSRRKGRQRDTPLLFRLLIAVFPFLGSWTSLL